MKNKRPTLGRADLNQQLDDTTKMIVLSMLTDKPQTRHVLHTAIGISDRALRRAIHDLRLEGNPICSDSNGQGYWIGSREERLKTAKELRSRALDHLKTARALEGSDPDQLTFAEVMSL